MVKRTLLTSFAVGLIASVGMADVSLHLSPDVLDIADGTQDLNIVMTSAPGTDQLLGSIGFGFDVASQAWSALDPTAFAWVPDVMNDPNRWFVTSDLPDPVAVAFGPGDALPIPDGVDVTIAALTVTPNTAGDFSLTLGANSIADEIGSPLQLDGGDPSPFTIIPEPASLSLLALGALAIIRRRR